MKMNIETLPSYPIVYIRHIGPYGVNNISTMNQLKQWAKAHMLLDDTSVILGIAHDDPETVLPENCRYDVCLVLTDKPLSKDASMHYGNTLAGKFGIITIPHTAEALRNIWYKIDQILSDHKCHHDTKRPIIERYAAKLLQEHKCQLCIPIL